MPNRILRDTTDSEAINELSFPAEVLFYRLMMKADDYGVFHAHPKLVKAAAFPLKDIRETDISRWLAECEKAGVIAFYEADSKPLLLIINFGQRLRNMKKRFPAPPEGWQQSAASRRESPHETETKPNTETETEDETESEEAGDEKKEQAIQVFYPFDSDKFKNAWGAWKKFLKDEHNQSYQSFSSEQAELTNLKEMSIGDEKAALHHINYSISKRWKGVYKDKDYGKEERLTTEDKRQQLAKLGQDALDKLLGSTNGENGPNG